MKLIDLEPRWIHEHLFVFLCPHCQEFYLTCKDVEMSMSEQEELYEKVFGEKWNQMIVPAKESFSWTLSYSRPMQYNAAFPTNMTVIPSIDASASGHWHGHITNGEIV